jgi:hypothetical protein
MTMRPGVSISGPKAKPKLVVANARAISSADQILGFVGGYQSLSGGGIWVPCPGWERGNAAGKIHAGIGADSQVIHYSDSKFAAAHAGYDLSLDPHRLPSW